MASTASRGIDPVRRQAIDRVKLAGIFPPPPGHENTPIDEIADSIIAIGNGVRKLRAGRLNNKALELLISWASGESQRTVRNVLTGMESLERAFLKPKKN